MSVLCAKQVVEVKQDQGDQTYYKPEREAQVLRRVMKKIKVLLATRIWRAFFRQ